MSCLMRSDGDQQKADYLFNCNVFEYYYRVKNFNTFVEEKNKAHEKMMEDAKTKAR